MIKYVGRKLNLHTKVFNNEILSLVIFLSYNISCVECQKSEFK